VLVITAARVGEKERGKYTPVKKSNYRGIRAARGEHFS